MCIKHFDPFYVDLLRKVAKKGGRQVTQSGGPDVAAFGLLGANVPACFAASLRYTPRDVFLSLAHTLSTTGRLGGNQQRGKPAGLKASPFCHCG